MNISELNWKEKTVFWSSTINLMKCSVLTQLDKYTQNLPEIISSHQKNGESQQAINFFFTQIKPPHAGSCRNVLSQNMDRYVDCGFRIVDCLCGLWTWRSLFSCAVMMLNVAMGSFLVDQKSLNARKVLLLGQKGLNWISFPRVNNYVMRGSQRWWQPGATILSLTQRSSLLPCLSFCSCYPI